MEGNGDTKETVRAKRFQVVDDNGQVRAELGLDQDGDPRLELHDKSGGYRIWMGLTRADEPSLAFVDESGNESLLIEDRWNINLNDATLNFHAPIGVDDKVLIDEDYNEFRAVALYGGKGARVTLGLDINGNPKLQFRDGNDTCRLAIGIAANGDARISFFDQNGWPMKGAVDG